MLGIVLFGLMVATGITILAVTEVMKIVKPENATRDYKITVLNKRRRFWKCAQESIEESMDKTDRCPLPELDPWSNSIMRYYYRVYLIDSSKCNKDQWVKCFLENGNRMKPVCKVDEYLYDSNSSSYSYDLKCEYRHIMYQDGQRFWRTDPVVTTNGQVYDKTWLSNHVHIYCTRVYYMDLFLIGKTVVWRQTWSGVITMELQVNVKHPKAGGKSTRNVLIFAFSSLSRHHFIRTMPRSYKFLTTDLRATFLTRYSTVSKGPQAALFPILTGKSEEEWRGSKGGWLNNNQFIFHLLRENGYRTAYFEDHPGAFHRQKYYFNQKPADHYIPEFFSYASRFEDQYCIQKKPLYKFMMDTTKQFFDLDGKRFCFTYMSHLSSYDYLNNLVSSADDDFVQFLTQFRKDGHLENTLVILMAAHGIDHVDNYQGWLEERLPLMAVILPNQLGYTDVALQSNTRIISTPFDIYETILDATELTKYSSGFRVKGSCMPRGQSLLKEINKNRTCEDAGVAKWWCTCHKLLRIDEKDPMYNTAPQAVVDHINEVIDSLGETISRICKKVSLKKVLSNGQLVLPGKDLNFDFDPDDDRNWANFSDRNTVIGPWMKFKVQISVDPGNQTYEATALYIHSLEKAYVEKHSLKRTTKSYNCLYFDAALAKIEKYCYC